MAHCVFRSDLMSGTDVNADLASVMYHTTSGTTTITYTPSDIDNGNVVKLDKLSTTNPGVWVGVAPAATTPITDLVIIGTPEVMYDERKANLDEFTNKAGTVARGYRLRSGNIFSITADGLVTELTSIPVGTIIELAAGTKLSAVAERTAAIPAGDDDPGTPAPTKIGEVIAVEDVGRYKYYVIKVA